jgi:hypothetical protein
VYRRVAILALLVAFIGTSVACSSSRSGELAEASSGSNLTSAKQVTLPAGTVVTVRLANAVGSKMSASGDRFGATLAKPIEVNGTIVVPAGSRGVRQSG